MTDKKMARLVGRAIGDFSMIRGGDRVAVGLSGGKDSAFLLRSLCAVRDKSPVKFEIEAITVDPTDGARDSSALGEFAASFGVRHKVVRYPIFDILEKSGAPSPCSLCANLRRGILASSAAELGCGALALGHHRDDAVETAFLNLLYEGRFRAFQPNMLMSRSGVRVIRPLIYVPESAVRAAAERFRFPMVNFCCGYESSSMRAYVKALLRHISRKAPSLHKTSFTRSSRLTRPTAGMTPARRAGKILLSAAIAAALAAGARSDAALRSPFGAAMSDAFSKFERASGAGGEVLGGVVPHHDIAADMMLRFYDTFPRDGARRVFIISPDHFSRARKWVAVCPGDWEFAGGTAPGDRAAAEALGRLGFVEIREDMFAAEHGVTVHVPLIAKFFPGASVVPIAIRPDIPDTALLSLRAAMKKILREGDAVILSADLSHYVPPEELASRDARTVKILTEMQAGATKSLDMDAQSGAALLMLIMRDMGAGRGELLERGDTSSVLGKRIEYGTGYATIIYRRN